MFDHLHYVPLLRSRPAELRALRDLSKDSRRSITPIIEVIPRTFSNCSSHSDVQDALTQMATHFSAWKGDRIMLDFNPLDWDYHDLRHLSRHPAEGLCDRFSQMGLTPVPLLTLKMAPRSIYGRTITGLMKRYTSGACLRISPGELSVSGGIQDLITRSLEPHGLSPANTDLVLDRCAVDSSSRQFAEIAPSIPWLNEWRTFTVLAGSFPEDLSSLAKGAVHLLRRHEWSQWEDIKTTWRGRKPAYGDYTIQHVYFKEPVVVPNFSASVRYTIEDGFLVLRGEGVLNPGGPGFRQWNGWAKYLTGLADYCGPTFSPGDGYADERARDGATPGNAQSWLQAGFSHHMTLVSLQARGLLEQARLLHQVVATEVPATVSDRPSAIH